MNNSSQEIPRHVAIIMDGNGRWAKKRKQPRVAGHRAGVKAVRQIVKCCAKRNIEALTLFAFSSENWRRPATEVGLLMELFVTALKQEVRKLHENNVRMRVIGDRSSLTEKLQLRIGEAERLTAGNTGLNLVVAANYGGRWDITEAARALSGKVKAGIIEPRDITLETFQAHLSLNDLPEPDLFIRTGGEQRISNYLLWQLAYTELYFTECLWPDFSPEHFEEALVSFGRRQRRFGRTGEQVEEAPGEGGNMQVDTDSA